MNPHKVIMSEVQCNRSLEVIQFLTESICKPCEAAHLHMEDIAVVEKFGSQTVWNGIVHVFKIEGHPKADKCYAWSSPIEGSTERRYYAVLHIHPIDSPEKAVRASIVQDRKTGKI
jgi:hypothetical protein